MHHTEFRVSHPRLVLLGPGLANLQVLRRIAGAVDVTLVSEGRTHAYSGMLPGVLAKQRALTAASIDLVELCARRSVKLEASGAKKLFLDEKTVELRDGRRLPFEVLSINVGAGVRGVELPGVREHATVIKPLTSGAAQLLQVKPPVVVAGAGVAAVELALVLQRRLSGPTTLVSSATPLPRASQAFVEAAQRELKRAGVTVMPNRRVVGAEPHVAMLDDGVRLPFATLVWATGPRALDFLADSGAAVDERGYLQVTRALQSTSHPSVFGAGDCVAIDGLPELEKSGVFSTRQGPTLLANIEAALLGREPARRFEPGPNPLQLINLGDGRALGAWRGHVFVGRAAWCLKELIDRRWLSKYPTAASD